MYYLFVVDYLIGIGISCLLSFIVGGDIEHFYIFIIPILIILNFLREQEAKVKGRLDRIRRKEFLKKFDSYDNFVYICNDNLRGESIRVDSNIVNQVQTPPFTPQMNNSDKGVDIL